MSDEQQPQSDRPDAAATLSSETVEAQLARSGIEPDLQEVLARARAKDPDAVPFGRAVRFGDDVAAATEPVAGHEAGLELDAGLLAYVAAYREVVDEHVNLRLLGPIAPPARAGGRGARAGGRARAALAGAVATLVAVVALAAVGGVNLVDRTPVHERASQAAHDAMGAGVQRATVPERVATARDGASTGEGVGDRSPAPTSIDARELDPELEDGPAADDGDAPEGGTDGPSTGEAAQARPRVPPRGATLEARLAELDERARAAWRAGSLSKAEALFRKIIKMGGKHRLAELAYGDLFALTAQRHRPLAPVWRGYLRRFPRGRYAEDARAGLCRLGPKADSDACWAAYRDDFPRGTHAP